MRSNLFSLSRPWTPALYALSLVILLSGCVRHEHAEETSPNVLTLTEASFEAEVLSASQPVLVDFWAPWCGPCRRLAPTIAALADEFEGRAKVGKVNVDDHPALAKRYEITAIPALLIFKDGQPVDRVVGLQSQEALRARLEQVIARAGQGT